MLENSSISFPFSKRVRRMAYRHDAPGSLMAPVTFSNMLRSQLC